MHHNRSGGLCAQQQALRADLHSYHASKEQRRTAAGNTKSEQREKREENKIMYGAVLGDIIGSPYEFDENNIKTKEFELFSEKSEFTDDSVMTVAVAEGLLDCGIDAPDSVIQESVVAAMRKYGRRYPFAGYGMNFSLWLQEESPKPYDSYGNGSAMRVSSAAWLCQDDLTKMLRIAADTALVTHNHREGIKGAQAVATAIFYALHGKSRDEIREAVTKGFGYDLSRTCDEIRPSYHHVESCQETVPQAITAFLESRDFEDAIRNAVSLGGDSDTIAAITGSIAEAFYGIPNNLREEARNRLPDDLRLVMDRLDEKIAADRQRREADPAEKARWESALDPAAMRGNARNNAAAVRKGNGKGVKGPNFTFGPDITAKIALMTKERTRENIVKCFEAVRRAMDGGGNLLVPVLPVQSAENVSNINQRRTFHIKAVRTGDDKRWQIAYTDESAIRSGRTRGKGITVAPSIREVLAQYVPEIQGESKAPANLSGLVLNPDTKPLFLSRQTISEIFKVDRSAAKRPAGSSILVTKGDITKLNIECIVNAADNSLPGSGEVSRAIQNEAGPEFVQECIRLGSCETGKARITGGYGLLAAHVIHTTGPFYRGEENEAELLADCYRNSLELARENNIHEIAFPNISTGLHGYPKEKAARIAMNAVGRWLGGHRDYVMHVILCCYDEENYGIYKKMVEERTKQKSTQGKK